MNYMPVLTVRLTDQEERMLLRRSRVAGVKKATFIRQLIRSEPYRSARDVLADMDKHWGNERLRVVRK